MACNRSDDDFCPGKYEVVNVHNKCKPVATGESGRTECYEHEQVVGYTAECIPKWNELLCSSCGAFAATCARVCVFAGEECLLNPIVDGACLACVLTVVVECGSCDIVDSCVEDENTVVEKTDWVFFAYAGCDCVGG